MTSLLMLGSAPMAAQAADWPRPPFDRILAINNAWSIRPDWDDARQKFVAISPAGRAARDAAVQSVAPLIADIVTAIGTDRVRAVHHRDRVRQCREAPLA